MKRNCNNLDPGNKEIVNASHWQQLQGTPKFLQRPYNISVQRTSRHAGINFSKNFVCSSHLSLFLSKKSLQVDMYTFTIE